MKRFHVMYYFCKHMLKIINKLYRSRGAPSDARHFIYGANVVVNKLRFSKLHEYLKRPLPFQFT